MSNPRGPNRVTEENIRAGVRVDDAIMLAGGTMLALASVWTPPLSKQTVHQWAEYMPSARAYQLRALKPAWFDAAGNLRKPTIEAA